VKKKRIILIAMLFLVFSGILWFATRREVPIEVQGNLSSKDVAAIKRVVRREMRRQVFPNFSWPTFKQLPKAVKKFSALRIKYISTKGNRVVAIVVTEEAGRVSMDDSFTLKKGTNGWQMAPQDFWDDPLLP
jgi:hypothetical protein